MSTPTPTDPREENRPLIIPAFHRDDVERCDVYRQLEELQSTNSKLAAEIAELRKRAHNVSQEEANELQAILRTLAPSGRAFVNSARQLVELWEKGRAELEAANAREEFLKSKGLTVGMLTESGKEPHLAYVIEPESELCDLRYIHANIDLKRELEAARKERESDDKTILRLIEERNTALTAKDEAEKKVAYVIDALKRWNDDRLKRVDEAEAEATKWKAENDMYGWNYHQGIAAGLNFADIMIPKGLSDLLRAALTPAPTQEPPAGKLPIGTKIRFLKTLDAAANDEHPDMTYAYKGEMGEITGHEAREGYFVKADRWPTPFGASLGDEFEAISPAGGVTISNESSGVEGHAAKVSEPSNQHGVNEASASTAGVTVSACSSEGETSPTLTSSTNSPADVPSEGRGEWLPIETAPDDKTELMLGWKNLVCSGHWDEKLNAWVTSYGTYRGSFNPTHWQPLPPPPMLPTEGSGACVECGKPAFADGLCQSCIADAQRD